MSNGVGRKDCQIPQAECCKIAVAVTPSQTIREKRRIIIIIRCYYTLYITKSQTDTLSAPHHRFGTSGLVEIRSTA